MVSVNWPGPSADCVYLEDVTSSSVDPFSHSIWLKGTFDAIVAVSAMSDPYTTLLGDVKRLTVMEPE